MLCYCYRCMFCKIHSIGTIYVCTNFEINRDKIDEFIKHAQIVRFFLCHVNQFKQCVLRHSGRTLLIDISIRNIFYLLSHRVGIHYWSLHARVHRNPSSING